jgi:putative hydrolase of the HAD superfamily
MTLAAAEAVLFDLGGTCIEIDHAFVAERVAARGPAPRAGWAPRGERAGRRVLEAMLRAGRSSDDQWRGFFEGMLEAAGAAPADRDAIFAELVAFHRRHHLWRRVMPGMPETLRGLLARGYRVAAISNADGRAESVLTSIGFAHEFEFVLDSHDLGVEKPDPRIFLDVPPARCAYVGDVVAIDVEGARAAGLHPVLFDAYGSYELDATGGAPRAAEPAQLLGLFPDRRDELAPRRSATR